MRFVNKDFNRHGDARPTGKSQLCGSPPRPEEQVIILQYNRPSKERFPVNL
jgi:hypothetical protein